MVNPYGFNSYNYGLPTYQFNQPNLYAQKQEVMQVNGENGARAVQLAPNSSMLAMDTTAPIVWLCKTDGAGYLSVHPFDIAPHQEPKAADLNTLEQRIERLEELINAKPNDAVSEQGTTAG